MRCVVCNGRLEESSAEYVEGDNGEQLPRCRQPARCEQSYGVWMGWHDEDAFCFHPRFLEVRHRPRLGAFLLRHCDRRSPLPVEA